MVCQNEYHKSISNLIGATFTKCAASGSVTLGANTTLCTAPVTTFDDDFETYFNSIETNNPYDQTVRAIVVGAASNNIGTTYLTASGTTITVTTIASSSLTLTDTILKE